MPLVRIDMLVGHDAAHRRLAGQVVHQAMVATCGVPADDRFQVITEHADANFIFDAGYLGIERTGQLIMVQITLNQGRTLDQKKALYKAIADGLQAQLGMRQEDVLVSLVEVTRENWSFGNGVAQYAP